MHQHVHYYVSPLQRHYVRCLAIIPIYAIESWLALRWKHQAVILTSVRDSYEAYVVYAFFRLMIDFLGGWEGLVTYLHHRELRRAQVAAAAKEAGSVVSAAAGAAGPAAAQSTAAAPPPVAPSLPIATHVHPGVGGAEGGYGGQAEPGSAPHAPRTHMPAPLCCLRAWKMDMSGEYVFNCAFGVFQYVFLRCALAFVQVVSEYNHAYCEGNWKFSHLGKCSYSYVAFILNVSQLHALYCLFLFFHDLWDELKPLNPFMKIFSIKMIVFVLFWQAIFIGLMAYFHVIKATATYTEEELIASLNSFLVCCEMFFFAIWFFHVFSVSDFKDGSQARTAHEQQGSPPGRVVVFELDAAGRAIPRTKAWAMWDILPHDVLVEAAMHHSQLRASAAGASARILAVRAFRGHTHSHSHGHGSATVDNSGSSSSSGPDGAAAGDRGGEESPRLAGVVGGGAPAAGEPGAAKAASAEPLQPKGSAATVVESPLGKHQPHTVDCL